MISEIQMPNMNGIQAIESCLKINPNLNGSCLFDFISEGLQEKDSVMPAINLSRLSSKKG